jgi:hypothetical protein
VVVVSLLEEENGHAEAFITALIKQDFETVSSMTPWSARICSMLGKEGIMPALRLATASC